MSGDHQKRGLPFSSIVAVFFLILVFYWFVSGSMYSFYASAVFFFYSITQMMWVSVIMLGVFQTILLIPFRIVRLLDFKKIRDFKSEALEVEGGQDNYLKRQFRAGSWTLTFYLLDFVVQLSTYITIGRLFLTDFYNKRLDPEVLFSFVKYPQYPIQERFFKIPYPSITKTIDLGFETVLYVWLLILIIELLVSIVSAAKTAKDRSAMAEAVKRNTKSKLSGKYLLVYGVILYFVPYALIRHFPVGMKLSIFTGDVAKQNDTFNTVTALATFFTLMWFGINDIIRKGKIAKGMGIPVRVVENTQGNLFKGTFFNAVMIGAAAYFITNHIPCAFELSIFTLEMISLLSPLTLDRWILRVAPAKIEEQDEEGKEKEIQEVGKQFLEVKE